MMENKFKKLEIEDIFVFKPNKFKDQRGYFFENFNFLEFKKIIGFDFNIIQENISCSQENVIRGLHFQSGKNAQSKLVTVLNGRILDVMVDVRIGSKSFGKWTSYYLDDKTNENIFIPAGFAHGFLALQNETVISYKVDKPYNKDSECCLLWNDKDININWPVTDPLLSSKDREGQTLDYLMKADFLK